jgi:hypothetical protein
MLPMRNNRIPPTTIRRYRRELALGVLLALLIGGLAAALPALVLSALIERKQGRRRTASARILRLQLRAIAWTWRKLRGIAARGWRPCEQCGYPIEPPSRARFCSAACRRYARLDRLTAAGDERAAARAAWLRRSADLDPTLSEIPF